MSRNNLGVNARPWSKLKTRVEALFAAGLSLSM
jgi:hypothetical protein